MLINVKGGALAELGRLPEAQKALEESARR
jgi:hypothetical protein